MNRDNLGIAKLGFGLMRLPKVGDTFDVDQIKAMVDAFLGAGFSYFDTAWSYLGSEEVIRKALVERHPKGKLSACHQDGGLARQDKRRGHGPVFDIA